MIPLHIIVAVDEKNGIGKDGGLPWHLPADLRHFKEITLRTSASLKRNAVIMGRKTWESIPVQFRPLPGRINLVLTRDRGLVLPEGVWKVESFENAIKQLNSQPLCRQIETVFVIGGGEVFKTALSRFNIEKIHLTKIVGDFKCDTFFPAMGENFQLISTSKTFQEASFPYYFAEFVSCKPRLPLP